MALQNYNPPDPNSSIFESHPLKGRQIRVLQIKPKRAQVAFGLPEEIIVCTVKTINLVEKSVDVLGTGYTALSWYCSHETPWNSKLLILPEAQAVLIPDHLAAALRDIRYPGHEIPVWAYQICIDHRSAHEVQEQTALVPDIFSHASEVMVWPGREDNSSAAALSFVPEVIDLRTIDDLVVGTPPVDRPRRDNTPASAAAAAKSPAAATAMC
jgi:hypothetical protein